MLVLIGGITAVARFFVLSSSTKNFGQKLGISIFGALYYGKYTKMRVLGLGIY